MENITFFESFKRKKEIEDNKKSIRNQTSFQKDDVVVKLSREQLFNRLFEYIASFKQMLGDSLIIKITSEEWKLFFNVVYKHFLEKGIIENYYPTMEFALKYNLSFTSTYPEGFKLEHLINNLDMPFMLCRIPNDVSLKIQEELREYVNQQTFDK